MEMFLCTPVLGKRRRDQSLDIESRIPAVIEDLRRWTSTEALGDVTVPPDCMSRILGDTTDDDAVDHKLPSPEEQVQAVALKFPAEIVAVDVSGRGFERMSMRRRSLLSGPENQETAVKRRSRLRRPRGKRRNTIAGTDQKEIRQAIGGETIGEDADETISNIASRTQRSASTDILGSSKKESPTEKKSHFNTLKAWGMSRLKLISPKSSQQQDQAAPGPASSATANTSSEAEQGQSRSPEEKNIYEMVTSRRRKEKSHERKPSSSSSSGKSISSIPVSVPTTEKQPSVKLRESAIQRRERRKGSNRDDPPHSSSGNWSASSESGRASIGSETTTTTHQPRSTTTASIGTSSTSLCHVRRFKGRDTSASSSVTSEGTLTPDIIQDIAVVPFSDDGETSSVYSCDTEGYYTSFHVDSGLKTLREEEHVVQTPLTKSNDVSSDTTSPTVENEYELFGRGSTSTTTSSAGTVCTALLAPPPPERKSSLTVVAMVHGQNQNGGESPDSGHNTSSSPVESASSPACTGRSCSEFEYSESSDLEGCERVERIRSKTAINTSRIPSMCVITPPGSDDELTRESEQTSKKNENRKPDIQSEGSVLMSATVGTSKMEVINGQDKNLYATVQMLPSPANDKVTTGQTSSNNKISPLSGVLGKLRGVLPGRKHVSKSSTAQEQGNADSGDYVTIADVRNNNDKRQESGATSDTVPAWSPVMYANSDIFKRDAEYVSLSELPKKPASSLERKRQGARVTLDSEGKVVYTSDSLKRRKGAHTTFNPGPFVREGVSPSPSPLLHRAALNIRAVTKSNDAVDGPTKLTPPTSPQLGKLIIRAARSPDRATSPDYVRTPATVVGPTSPTTAHRQVRGAYVNMQEDEDNTLLAIDSVPPHGIIQPPYASAQESEECKREHKAQEVAKNTLTSQNAQAHCEKHENHGAHGHQPQKVYPHDPRRDVYNNNKYLEQNQAENCSDYQRACKQRQIVSMHNARNQQYCASGRHAGGHQFYTLPSRRPRRDVEPPRSITPDITRGLGHGSLSAVHMFAMQGQFESQVDLHGRNLENLEAKSRLMPNRQQPIAGVRNRFATPLGLTALGYRFFGSSPVRDPVTKTSSADALKHNPISPTRHSHDNSFTTSTPIGRTMPTIADRLALIDSNNCSPPSANSGRNTPTNLVLSPTKSTMSNEELFAAIHKSKKRLNIRDDGENLSPYGSTKSLAKLPPGNRHSWSSEMQKPPVVPQNAQTSSPATSRLDFKRLLLQQSVKTGPTRLSAAEQLKLSRQQSQQQQSSPMLPPTTPLAKVLSPRSVWRFQTPRTDVLSSTIIEDTAAEEKAMKPSPENTSPISRLNARRQLDLCNEVVENLCNSNARNNISDVCGDGVLLDKVNDSDTIISKEVETYNRNIQRQEPTVHDCTLSGSDSYLADNLQTVTTQNSSAVQCVSNPYPEQNSTNPAIQYSFNCTQLTPSCQKAISAFESRRLSNQLARAQFLAGAPSTNPGHNTYVRQILRARSESPQNIASQNVARSPSAPTLETAL
nr:uncharacterized protein LOC116426463 isoform X2 [Nomia melanderi]